MIKYERTGLLCAAPLVSTDGHLFGYFFGKEVAVSSVTPPYMQKQSSEIRPRRHIDIFEAPLFFPVHMETVSQSKTQSP